MGVRSKPFVFYLKLNDFLLFFIITTNIFTTIAVYEHGESHDNNV